MTDPEWPISGSYLEARSCDAIRLCRGQEGRKLLSLLTTASLLGCSGGRAPDTETPIAVSSSTRLSASRAHSFSQHGVALTQSGPPGPIPQPDASALLPCLVLLTVLCGSR